MAEVEVDAALAERAARVAASRGERIEDVIARILTAYASRAGNICPPNRGRDTDA